MGLHTPISRPSHDKGRGGAKVGFLLTEVDIEAPATLTTALPTEHTLEALPAIVAPQSAEKAKVETSVALPLISGYRVTHAELPPEVNDPTAKFAPLPTTFSMDSVMTNVFQSLDRKAKWSDKAKTSWFKVAKSPPSYAVISDTFWYCICVHFKEGQHEVVENQLLDRISVNFVALFRSVSPSRKDFFFRWYPDAVAQAVLYAMFLAYPKSRVLFTENFRKKLIAQTSEMITGIRPEFVDASHWKLNLGGGDVLDSNTCQTWQHGSDEYFGSGVDGTKVGSRQLKDLRYSPLIDRFLKSRKYSSINLVRETKMNMTTAEEKLRIMDKEHSKLLKRATEAREKSDRAVQELNEECLEVKKQERARLSQAQNAKKKLEKRRKEVLRSDPHEYANYLVSLHLLQQGEGQST